MEYRKKQGNCQYPIYCAILTSGKSSMKKVSLRQRLLLKLRQQPERLRFSKSRAIGQTLRRLHLYKKAGVVMCYVAIDGEVETRPFLSQALADGKRVVVPVTLKKSRKLIAVEIKDPGLDLKRRGPFKIPQPRFSRRRAVPPEKLDLVIVPGIAFDRRGRRLGRGLGYFDRFLAQVPASVPRVGLAFRFQVLKKIPSESHDQPVDRVITEKGVIASPFSFWRAKQSHSEQSRVRV